MIRAAAGTFSVRPEVGSGTTGLTGERARAVYSPLKTTVTLLEDDDRRICLVASHFCEEYYPYSNLKRQEVAAAVGISPEDVLSFTSHNHSDVLLSQRRVEYGLPRRDAVFSGEDLTPVGQECIETSASTAASLQDKLQPVDVCWSLGHETRITYNRKGRRSDGQPYLMREEDRQALGEDFSGEIDDDAPVVAFLNRERRPICFLVQFTGHPATAYHPEDPVVFGEYPQVACDQLSAHWGNVPVGFLQGCAGDCNSKGLVSSKAAEKRVANARDYGRLLGGTYVEVSHRLVPSSRNDLDLVWETVALPFAPLPSRELLDEMMSEIENFLKRCSQGDENTRDCVGLNFPTTLSPRYRAELVTPSRRWVEWALSLHKQGSGKIPREVELEIGVLRIADVGIIGMPSEPFMGIGKQIKKAESLPLVIPCGYCNDCGVAYVPDSANNGEWDYQSSFFRYTTSLLPYENPAGDVLAQAATSCLRRMAESRAKPEMNRGSRLG